MKEWLQFIQELECQLGKESVEKWCPKCAHFDAANIYLEAKDSFQITWFEEYAQPKLKGLVNQNGRPIKVHFLKEPKKELPQKTPTSKFTITEDPIDPEMTLENFVISEDNLVVHKILTEDSSFNPIYIYGSKGVGKTHLLMGAAHYHEKQGKRVFFVKATSFTEHFVQAIRLAEMQAFRKIYRDIDVLIIDDVNIFSKKSATQEEFFHTFNTLHTLGRPIILSATHPPTELQEIEPRLISRFEWGISLEVNRINVHDILKSKAEIWQFPLSENLRNWLVSSFPKDPILALQALIYRAKGITPSIILAEKLLKDLLEKEKQEALTSEKIIKKVAICYGITSEDILGKSQVKTIALPRKVAMYYCREKLKLPFQTIGKVFSKDHSTVMSSCKQIQKALDKKEIDPLHFPCQ